MGSVANRVKLLRVTHDLTQEQLGAALGVTRQTILAVENGKYLPSIELALRMAEYFQVPLESIFWLEKGEVGDNEREADSKGV